MLKALFIFILALLASSCNTGNLKHKSLKVLEKTTAGENETKRQRNKPVIVASAGGQTVQGILIDDGFESTGADWRRQTARTGNITSLAKQKSRAGSKAARFVVEKADRWVAGGPRSELIQPRSMGYWHEGSEYWVGASVLFPSDYVDDPAREIFWQVHGDKSSPAVPFLIQSIDGDILIKGKGFQDKRLPKTKGTWMDIVVHHVWSSQSQGTTQVYVNGDLVVDAQHISNMRNGIKLYWKFGMYKSGWKHGGSNSVVTKREIWFDEVRLGGAGSNYTQVAPR